MKGKIYFRSNNPRNTETIHCISEAKRRRKWFPRDGEKKTQCKKNSQCSLSLNILSGRRDCERNSGETQLQLPHFEPWRFERYDSNLLYTFSLFLQLQPTLPCSPRNSPRSSRCSTLLLTTGSSSICLNWIRKPS